MRKTLLFLFLGIACLSRAQSVSGTIPSTGGGASCVSVATDSQGIVAISVTGTWTGTIQPQVTVGGDAAGNVQVTPYSSSTAQSTITANGVFRATVAGATQFQVCGNTVATGTANIKLNVVKLAANANAGTGTGTISANSGSANALAIYPAAGGSTTVSPDATASDDGTTLTYTGTGGVKASNGGFASGTATVPGFNGDTYPLIAAPATPSAGTLNCWGDSTDLTYECKNSAGTVFKLNGIGTLFSVSTQATQVTTAGSPQFFPANGLFSGSGGEGNTTSVIGGTGCTARNAYAITTGSNGTGALTITLRNGTTVAGMANTTIVITVGSGAAAGVYSDLTHTVAIAAGSIVTWTASMGGAAQTSAQIVGIGFQCN